MKKLIYILCGLLALTTLIFLSKGTDKTILICAVLIASSLTGYVIYKLNKEILKLQREIRYNEELEEQLRISELVEARDISSLQQIIKNKNIEKDKIIEDIDNLKKEIKNCNSIIEPLKRKIESLEKERQKLQIEVSDLTEIEYYQNFGIYTPKYEFANSSAYKLKLESIRESQKLLIKNDRAVDGKKDWQVDGSKRRGKQMVNKNIKMMLRAFNGECDTLILKVKKGNFYQIEKRIRKSFEDINRMNTEIRLTISHNYLDLKLQELNLACEYAMAVEKEKEILREQREKEKEERALQKEIENQKAKLDKEISHMNNIILELKTKFDTATEDEKVSLELQLKELENNVFQMEQKKEDLDFRKDNLGAGYVYIISNIGAFGENVFKIGVTRRLDPLERIAELSSASVPFKFDVHALIFSYKAYELESNLHKIFDKKRVNLVNTRKEFFNIDISEIEKELSNYKDLTIEFKKDADANEYRETLKIREVI